MVFMGWRGLLALTLWAGLADARAQDYPAPGFDCANASSPQELRICRSPQLSGLDGRHWYLAERAIRGAEDRDKARSGVERWINEVRNACQDDKCLEDAYVARIGELERNVATLAPEKPPPQPRMVPTTPSAPAVPSTSTAAVPVAPAPAAPPPAPARASTAPPEPDAGIAIPYWIWALAFVVGWVALKGRKRGQADKER
jgi:uncharacterized protein